MSDKPILFSAPMVRALLAGTKTQTRRVIRSARVFATPERPAWTLSGEELARAMQGADRFRRMDGNGWFWEADAFEWQRPHTRTGWLAHIGYAPGDRLYVREHWRTETSEYDGVAPRDLPATTPVLYEADADWSLNKTAGRFRQGMHMPRRASRITLTVTDVRVQRIKEISRDDAMAEGITRVGGGMLRWEKWSAGIEGMHGFSPEAAYALLWNHINGPGAWDANPWVAAYAFAVELGNIDTLARSE